MSKSAAFRFGTIALLLAILGAGLASLVLGSGPSDSAEIIVPRNAPREVVVHVSGAVAHEGVYTLQQGDRVIDAASAAGGLLDDADTTRLNLAARLIDGERIHVPISGEAPIAALSQDSPRLDLNDATAAELEELPGIGAVRARAILEYRAASGAYLRVEDLLLVDGIGPATFERLRPLLVVR